MEEKEIMELQVGNYADIDLDRSVRQGMPEVIYGAGKTAEQIVGIASAMRARGIANILITRLDPEKAEQVGQGLTQEKAEQVRQGLAQEKAEQVRQGLAREKAEKSASDSRDEKAARARAGEDFVYDAVARIGIVNRQETKKQGKIVVVAAGTSDLPVAEEAAVTAELFGNYVERIYDVGVAGIHRLLNRLPAFEDANAVIAVAGMEGALVSVIGGLVACPVVGVPTSVGYGASFGGLAALLAMLNSCASGVSIVNIDNGFGAGVLASKINRQSLPGEDQGEGMRENRPKLG